MLELSRLSALTIGLGLAMGVASVSLAQQPKGQRGGKPKGGDPKEGPAQGPAAEDVVARLMALVEERRRARSTEVNGEGDRGGR